MTKTLLRSLPIATVLLLACHAPARDRGVRAPAEAGKPEATASAAGPIPSRTCTPAAIESMGELCGAPIVLPPHCAYAFTKLHEGITFGLNPFISDCNVVGMELVRYGYLLADVRLDRDGVEKGLDAIAHDPSSDGPRWVRALALRDLALLTSKGEPESAALLSESCRMMRDLPVVVLPPALGAHPCSYLRLRTVAAELDAYRSWAGRSFTCENLRERCGMEVRPNAWR